MASSGQWALSPYERRHTSNSFYSEHPGRSQTAGRQRHASGLTRYPADRSFDPSPSHRNTHRSHAQHSVSEGHGSNRHREHHADSVSLSRSRSRGRDYDDYGRGMHSSNHGSHHSSRSGSLANSQTYSHSGDRERRGSRSRDYERGYSHTRDYDYESSRNRNRGRDRLQSHKEHETSRRRRRTDESEYSSTHSDARSDSGTGYSYSTHDSSEVYDSRNRSRRHGSLRDERGRGDRTDRDKNRSKAAKARHINSDCSPLTDPEDISRIAAFLLIVGAVFTLTAYILIVLVGRSGWRSPNFWFELLFYVFILVSIMLYAFNIQRVVDFLSRNFPFATSRIGYASVLMFLALRSWPRTWPVDVTNQIEVYIAGNICSLVGLVVAFSLYFIE